MRDLGSLHEVLGLIFVVVIVHKKYFENKLK